jgi:RimJ/RimL family protein N-acetyltransferase
LVNKANQINWLDSLNREDIHTPKNLVLIAAVPENMVWSARVDDSNYIKIGVFKIFGIDWQSRIGQVGWDIYKVYRGKGFGHKIVKAGVDFCFKVLNLHRVEADILATNAVSHKCAMAAGFEKEGCKRRSILRDGKWVDNFIYGMITPDPE